MKTTAASHIAEKNTCWNISRFEDRGWVFLNGRDGQPRYLLRMEDGAVVARSAKVVQVTLQYGEPTLPVSAKSTVTCDDLAEGDHVIVVGRRVGYLSWFPGHPEYNGSNIDGGVIYKTYVSSPHRRKGVATAMLRHARALHPEKDIRHSSALSEDGFAFARATPTQNDLMCTYEGAA